MTGSPEVTPKWRCVRIGDKPGVGQFRTFRHFSPRQRANAKRTLLEGKESPTLIVNERRMVGIQEAKMTIQASSSLKRSRTLPNCSREGRIRDGPC